MTDRSAPADRVVAHRGYAAAFPENTMPAFEAAVRAGCRFVECDLQLAADAVPVVLHDESLARTFGDPRSIFDVRSDRGDLPEALPTLDLFLDWLHREPGVTAFLEIKCESIDRFGRERVARAVLAALAQAPASRPVVISFDDEIQAPFRDAGFAIGRVLRTKTPEVMASARSAAPDWLFYDIAKPGADDLEPGPWRWCLYEVANAASVARFRERDDVYFETMQVERLRDELRAGGGHRTGDEHRSPDERSDGAR